MLYIYALHRDDLISVFFVFLDLLLGRLPWSDEAKAKNKAVVQEMKEKVSPKGHHPGLASF